ncbi:type IV pilus assembly protein PilM [bacterium]|nr:type IV pilus assembly protein PilM [bacterium]
MFRSLSHFPTFSLSRFSLGLDIGTNSIKVTQLLKTKRGVRFLNFWEKEIPREKKGVAGEEAVVRTITELLFQIKGERKIISSLPASSSVVKRLILPFKNERKIRQVIRYEMEPFLPFPLEEAIIDFYIVDNRLPDRTLVLAFAINKRVVERRLKILDKAGLKPEVVDLDSTSLFNIYALKEEKETVALINLGASQTIIDIISEGRLFFSRSISKAGDDVSQALAERFEVSFKEAKKLKREGLDEEKLKAIEPVLDEIKKEIEYTFSSFLAFYPDKKVERIILTGGSARLPGIVEYFQKSLSIGTSLFNPFQEPPPTKLSLSGLKEFFIPSLKEISHALGSATLEKTLSLLPQVIGIAMRGAARTRIAFDFIREEKPLIKRLVEARPLLKPAAILLISIFLLGLVNFYIHLHLGNKRCQKLEKEIRLVFKKTFPEVINIVHPLTQMKDGLEKREEDLALSPREFSLLAILREISSLTPKDLGITIEDLSIDWGETRIRGRTSTPDFSLVDRFKKALEGSDYFTEVKVSDAHLSRKGKNVEFRMTIKYGK